MPYREFPGGPLLTSPSDRKPEPRSVQVAAAKIAKQTGAFRAEDQQRINRLVKEPAPKPHHPKKHDHKKKHKR